MAPILTTTWTWCPHFYNYYRSNSCFS